ncbi:hypothetical protein O6H91_02G097600 [Diphasiastrum complanatum]|uniref:Uncharacterized protein n=1 Tax=Diphasiastrum complanatum TaxID=34168 RepID=A0ACC2EIY2_DIPCM|nr:hypothetical protein O6H91_02G097600 [Diphasiastrum complanatum]
MAEGGKGGGAAELEERLEGLKVNGIEAELEEGEIASSPAAAAAGRPDKFGDVVAKHPLEHSWAFWFDNPSGKSTQTTWGSSLRHVYTFSTVEDFWCLFNNVRQPSQLILGADFYCFKAGIEPKWEAPKCASGGKWTMSTLRGSKATFDTFWLHTLLAMIGEQFDEGDEICGAVVNVRARQDKISLWTKTASNEAAQISIGKQWKEILDQNEKINYMFHEDAIRQDKHAKNRYTV